MDNKPLDVPGEVAKVGRIALDAVVLHTHMRTHFVEQFLMAAGDDMARPVRIEDIESYAELAADQMLADRELRDTLVSLLKSGISAYMEPA